MSREVESHWEMSPEQGLLLCGVGCPWTGTGTIPQSGALNGDFEEVTSPDPDEDLLIKIRPYPSGACHEARPTQWSVWAVCHHFLF